MNGSNKRINRGVLGIFLVIYGYSTIGAFISFNTFLLGLIYG
ncbi:unnamed protein product, partial [marine sediment metagenome]